MDCIRRVLNGQTLVLDTRALLAVVGHEPRNYAKLFEFVYGEMNRKDRGDILNLEKCNATSKLKTLRKEMREAILLRVEIPKQMKKHVSEEMRL